MASFKAERGHDRLGIRGKQKLSSRSIKTRPGIGNSKKIAKKFKKGKNIIMATFQSKTGRNRQRMREKKKIVPISS